MHDDLTLTRWRTCLLRGERLPWLGLVLTILQSIPRVLPNFFEPRGESYGMVRAPGPNENVGTANKEASSSQRVRRSSQRDGRAFAN